MPSWNDEESSDDGSLLSGFTEGLDDSPRPPCPESVFCPDFHGIDARNLRCKHDKPLHKFVAFEGADTGRKFLGCVCLEDGLCDTVVWEDDEWPQPLQQCLLQLWSLYDGEKRTRLSDNVAYAEKNYRLVLEKRELEHRNLELHKEIGNTLEMSQKATSHELELQKARRQKAEQLASTLKEENRKVEQQVSTVYEEKRKLEQELRTVKEEKKKVEFYIADMLKAVEVHKNKLKKISEILEE